MLEIIMKRTSRTLMMMAAVSGLISGTVSKDQKETGSAHRDAHAKAHGCVRASFRVNEKLPPELRQPMGARFQQATFRFAAMISDGIVDGSIRPVDPLIAAQTVMAMVNSSPERCGASTTRTPINPIVTADQR